MSHLLAKAIIYRVTAFFITLNILIILSQDTTSSIGYTIVLETISLAHYYIFDRLWKRWRDKKRLYYQGSR